MTYFKRIFLGLSVLGFAACGSGGGGGGDSSFVRSLGRDIQGNWHAVCAAAHDVALSENAAIFVTGDTFRRTIQLSFSAKCATWDVRVVEDAGLFIGDKVHDGVRDLDLTLRTMVVTPLTTTGAALLNGLAYCGRTDWAFEVSHDVTGTIGRENCFVSRAPKYSTVYQIEGDTLFLGLMTSSSSTKNINRNQIFKRPTQSVPRPPPEPSPTPTTYPDHNTTPPSGEQPIPSEPDPFPLPGEI